MYLIYPPLDLISVEPILDHREIIALPCLQPNRLRLYSCPQRCVNHSFLDRQAFTGSQIEIHLNRHYVCSNWTHLSCNGLRRSTVREIIPSDKSEPVFTSTMPNLLFRGGSDE